MNKKLFLLLAFTLPSQTDTKQPPIQPTCQTVLEYLKTVNLSVPPSTIQEPKIKTATKKEAEEKAAETNFAEKIERQTSYPAIFGFAILAEMAVLMGSETQYSLGRSTLVLGAATVAYIREYYRLCEVETRYQKALTTIADSLYPELLEKNLLNNIFNQKIQNLFMTLKTINKNIVTAVYEYENDFEGLCQEIEINGCLDRSPLVNYSLKLTTVISIYNELTKTFEEILENHDRLPAKVRDQIEELSLLIENENTLCKKMLVEFKKEPAFQAELNEQKEHMLLQAQIEREKAAKKAAEEQAQQAWAQTYAAQQQAQAAREQANAARQQANLARQEYWNNLLNRNNNNQNR